jgi:glycogen phosphorylase
MFEQGLRDGFQTETPDYWLSGGNPWEIPRLDIHYPVHFYGEVHSWVENGVTKVVLLQHFFLTNPILLTALNFPV